MFQKIIFVLFLTITSAGTLYPAESDNTIRVAIVQDVTSFSLRVKGRFEVYDLNAKKLIAKASSLRKQAVRILNNKIIIRGIPGSVSALQIAPLKGGYVFINGRIFRGRINLIVKPNGKILVVNESGVEDYLRGILCNEVAPWWPMDALKSQAIIARSYGLYQKQFPKDKYFDLTSDIYSQVYGGKSSERWRTNRAVDLTRGRILTYQGKLFPTYYHATCGGHTEDASKLWNVDLLPLKGVVCNFCVHSPHYKWQAKMSLQDISSKLILKGFRIQEISGIEIIGYDGSGRISGLEIKSQDKGFPVSAKDFRQALGPNIIRSANFTSRIDSGAVHFEGLGWGHGVGLCQWGMQEMAREGSKYEQILKYYFPQSELSTFK
ncbi:MAG: hypothetical protein A3J51_02600 [Omnitrophica WOR_2 bacterium RIFCSPHIGHO2_02_FULL_45_21]|nr:MAG: hypothetical protein A3J51_02600 [Omnitrophica WOR_2 bacterium RIFCSPHIGHO2_02_FULL_45_21]